MKKLTEKHPLTEKLRKVEDLCYELGITFTFTGYDIRVSDESGEDYIYADAEGINAKEVPTLFDGSFLRLIE